MDEKSADAFDPASESAQVTSQEDADGALIIRDNPSVIQAIYHAATGKTESTSKSIHKTVLVRHADLDRLVALIRHQLKLYTVVAGPTVTASFRLTNKKTYKFSSWERFSLHNEISNHITSDVHLKFEFIIQLPEAAQPQRCIINVHVDSKLLMFEDNEFNNNIDPNFIHILGLEIPAIRFTVEYVDFLLGETFVSVIDKWADSLEEIKAKNFLSKIYKLRISWRLVSDRVGLIGLAIFLGIFSHVAPEGGMSILSIVQLAAVSCILYAIFSLGLRGFAVRFERNLPRCFLQSMIVLTDADKRLSQKALEGREAAAKILPQYIASWFMAIILNVIASFIYAWISR